MKITQSLKTQIMALGMMLLFRQQTDLQALAAALRSLADAADAEIAAQKPTA
jgi:hypothetical protein